MSKPYRDYTEQDIYNLIQEIKLLKKENEELKESVRKNKLKRKESTEKYQALKDFTNKETIYIRTEKEDLIYELNRANKLCEEATLNYMNMCKQVEVLEKVLGAIKEICEREVNNGK